MCMYVLVYCLFYCGFCVFCASVLFLCTDFLSSRLIFVSSVWASLLQIKRWNGMKWNGMKEAPTCRNECGIRDRRTRQWVQLLRRWRSHSDSGGAETRDATAGKRTGCGCDGRIVHVWLSPMTSKRCVNVEIRLAMVYVSSQRCINI